MMQKNRLRTNAAEVLRAYLTRHSMRHTPERYAILEVVTALKGHFEIEDIYSAMEAEMYHVSRGTVYNTIELLCKCGILRQLLIESHKALYEVADGNHAHLICNNCGKVKEVAFEKVSDLLPVAMLDGFSADYVSATAYGLCGACARRRRRVSKQKQKNKPESNTGEHLQTKRNGKS